MSDSPGRKAVNARTTPFLPYDMEGPVQPKMSWLRSATTRRPARARISCGWSREP